MNTLPNLNHLRFLVAVAEQQSFSRAAKQCGVPQPTLSQGIMRLEEILQTPLILRTSKKLTFTEAGLAAVTHAKRMLAESDALLGLAQKDPFTEQVTIGSIPTLLPSIVGRWVRSIRDRYPNLGIDVVEKTSEELSVALMNAEVDFVLAATPFDALELPEFSVKNLWHDPFYQVTSKHTDQPKEDLLLLEQSHCLSGHALAACVTDSSAQAVHFQSCSVNGLVEMVANDLGTTYLPRTIIDYLKRSSTIVDQLEISPLPEAACRQISAIWRKGCRKELVYQALSQLAVEVVE